MARNQERLSQDLVFDLLSSPRRRFVLYYLRKEGPEEIHDLADRTAAWEYDTRVEELTSQQQKRVYVSLYQTHIPKLNEAGIVDYDQDTGMVRLTDQGVDIDRYLTTAPERSLPWQLYYLALSAASAVLYLLVTFGVGPMADVSELLIGAIIVAAFLLLAVVHFLYQEFIGQTTPRELRNGG